MFSQKKMDLGVAGWGLLFQYKSDFTLLRLVYVWIRLQYDTSRYEHVEHEVHSWNPKDQQEPPR